MNAPIETIRVPANGLDFEVETCGSGERLALCLHGFPEHAHSWRLQLPLLAELGYRAWAPNQRGYGTTTRPSGVAPYGVEYLMADVAGLIDASGATSVTLIAHDWGAIVAWLFATRRIRRLERLVIMNVPHPAVFAKALSFAQLRRSWYVFFFQIPWLPEKMLGRDGAKAIGAAIRNSSQDRSRFPREVTDVYRRNAAQPGALATMLAWYRAFVRGGFAREMKRGFPEIETPTLLVWGEADHALGKETTYGTDRYVRDLTVRFLPGVSHWVQQEAPETVNAMLSAFLQGRPVPYAPGAEPHAAAAATS